MSSDQAIKGPTTRSFLGRYHLWGGKKSLLGSGGFAKVYRVVDLNDGGVWALKVVPKDRLTPSSANEISLEIASLVRCDHPAIIRVGHFVATDHHFMLPLEYCSGGDLFDFIDKQYYNNLGPPPPAFVRLLFLQLMQGLHYIHTLVPPIIHRDVKPENIMLSRPPHPSDPSRDILGNPMQIKLIDFGLAKIAHDAKTLCGTDDYLSPEQLQLAGPGAGPETYTSAVDIWAAGVTLYFLLTGSLPFEPGMQMLDQMLQRRYSDPDFVNYDTPAHGACFDALDPDPTRRPSAHEFLHVLNTSWPST